MAIEKTFVAGNVIVSDTETGEVRIQGTGSFGMDERLDLGVFEGNGPCCSCLGTGIVEPDCPGEAEECLQCEGTGEMPDWHYSESCPLCRWDK